VLQSEAESVPQGTKTELASTFSHNFGNQLLYTNGYKRLKLVDLSKKGKMTSPDIQ